jgi:hypothetical protein
MVDNLSACDGAAQDHQHAPKHGNDPADEGHKQLQESDHDVGHVLVHHASDDDAHPEQQAVDDLRSTPRKCTGSAKRHETTSASYRLTPSAICSVSSFITGVSTRVSFVSVFSHTAPILPGFFSHRLAASGPS